MDSINDITVRFQAALTQSTIVAGSSSRQLVAGQTGRIALAKPVGNLSAVQARAWGDIRPGQACLVGQDGAGFWHALPTAGTQLVRRQMVSYRHALPVDKQQPVYPFKILLRKSTPQGQEFYLAGDRPRQFIRRLPSNAVIDDACVANLGSGIDEWAVFFRYRVSAPGSSWGRTYTLECYTPELENSVSFEAVSTLRYIGSGFWSSQVRNSFGIEELDYSGFSSFNASCTPIPEPTVNITETIHDIITNTINILIAYDPSLIDSGPRTYVNSYIRSQMLKRVTVTTQAYTRTCVEEMINLYADLTADLSKNSASYTDHYQGAANNVGTGYYSDFEGKETERIDTIFQSHEVLLQETTTVIVPDLGDKIDTSASSSSTNRNNEIAVQVAPNIVAIQHNISASSVSVNWSSSSGTSSTSSSSFSLREITPFLAGRESAIYRVYSYSSPSYVESNILEYDLGDGGQPLPNSVPPLNGKYSNLIGKDAYSSRPSDFNNQTANRDFESTVRVVDITTGQQTTVVGTVFNLGSRSEFTIESMVYFPPDQ